MPGGVEPRAFDPEVGQPVQPARQVPVAVAQQRHAAGTRTERTMVASRRTATARPKPICWNITSRPVAKPAKTATMISAAPVMILRRRLQPDRDRFAVVGGSGRSAPGSG